MAAAERHEFEKKALSVIERLLEVPVEEEFFLNAVQHMEPRHYDDVVEERSILNLCGYPLCCKALGDVPKQKYHISLANKKVYDLSQRKVCLSICLSFYEFSYLILKGFNSYRNFAAIHASSVPITMQANCQQHPYGQEIPLTYQMSNYYQWIIHVQNLPILFPMKLKEIPYPAT
jgi:hypothetical protein